jgi:hypothetical protein
MKWEKLTEQRKPQTEEHIMHASIHTTFQDAKLTYGQRHRPTGLKGLQKLTVKVKWKFGEYWSVLYHNRGENDTGVCLSQLIKCQNHCLKQFGSFQKKNVDMKLGAGGSRL